ncbi:hypothetical protein KCU87_g481, partial [Aureobasidium melanogenum]
LEYLCFYHLFGQNKICGAILFCGVWHQVVRKFGRMDRCPDPRNPETALVNEALGRTRKCVSEPYHIAEREQARKKRKQKGNLVAEAPLENLSLHYAHLGLVDTRGRDSGSWGDEESGSGGVAMSLDLATDDFDFNEVPRRQERLERRPISQCGMRSWMKRNERRSCDGTSFLDSSNQTSEPKIDNDRRHPHLRRLRHSDGPDTVAIMPRKRCIAVFILWSFPAARNKILRSWRGTRWILHTFPMMTTTRKQVPYYAYYATQSRNCRVDYSGRAEGSPRYSGMLWSSPALSRLYTRFRKPDEWDRYTHQVRTLITVVCKVSLKCSVSLLAHPALIHYSRARSNNSRSLVPDHEAISSVSANYTTKSARLMEEIGGDERTHQLRT